jgi:hypothetical protein
LPIEFVPERNKRFAQRLGSKRRFAMKKPSVTAAITAIAILTLPVISFAQTAGGAASGASAGTGSAVGSPNAGSAGVDNSAKLSSSPSAGTNSAGTAQSSGSGVNTAPGMTTGSGPQTNTDAAIAEENKTIDRKLNSICRGC